VDFAQTLAAVLDEREYAASWILDPNTPEEMVVRVGREPPDLLVLSLHNVGRDRYRMLDTLRANAPTRYVPLLVLTMDPALAGSALASPNVRGALTKPFDLGAFKDAVARALNQPAPSTRQHAARRSRIMVDAERVMAEHSREALFAWVQRLLTQPYWQSRPSAKLIDVLDGVPILVDTLTAALHDGAARQFLERHPGVRERAHAHARARLEEGVPWEALLSELAILQAELWQLLVQHLALDSDQAQPLERLRRTLTAAFTRIVEAEAEVFGVTSSDARAAHAAQVSRVCRHGQAA
jgi:CheY-like chemotaxis protein